MPLPQANEAKRFYRAALQRFDEAQFLLRGNRTTCAIYLAGYGIECMLKALILSAASTQNRSSILADFRGKRAHNFEWLCDRYYQNGGASFPGHIANAFALVNAWDPDLRYQTHMISAGEATRFLSDAERIIQWAQERM